MNIFNYSIHPRPFCPTLQAPDCQLLKDNNYPLAIFRIQKSTLTCLLLFFYTFICINFLQHLFPDHKFLFLQLLLTYLFFWAASSSALGTSCSFSVRIISARKGELMYRLIRPSWLDQPVHELCKSYTASWELCSPGCAQ